MAELSLLSDLALGEGDNQRIDALGFEPYSQTLSEAVKGTRGPFTIGIFGEWGSGKTSLLNLIFKKLEKLEKKIIIIKFDAWRFEREEHPIVPLVAAISYELESHEKLLTTQKDRLKSLREILLEIASSFQVSAKVKLPLQVDATFSFFPKKKQVRDSKIAVSQENSLYYAAFKTLSGFQMGDIKVAVLIDDLDRCFPDMAIKMLETIKLILSQKGFIFVIGVSRNVIEGYLRHRYSKRYGMPEFRSSQYLDKIVQLPWPIPPIGGIDKIRAFTLNLLNEVSPEYREMLKDLVPWIGSMCSNNPRAIIRFLNNLMVCKKIHGFSLAGEAPGKKSQDKLQIPIGYFAVSQGLQQRWPKVFQGLYSDHDFCLEVAGYTKEKLDEKYASLKGEDQDRPGVKAQTEVVKTLIEDEDLAHILMDSDLGKDWLENPDLRKSATEFIRSLLVVTSEDLSLVHRSWRAAKFDERYPGRKMYRFDAYIHAADHILDRIESVTYDLRAGGYPEPIQVKTKKDRPKAFKLKELAWGSSLLRAEVKIEKQAEPIRLEQRITLTESSDLSENG